MNCKRHKNLGYKPEKCDDCNEIERPVSKSVSVGGYRALFVKQEEYIKLLLSELTYQAGQNPLETRWEYTDKAMQLDKEIKELKKAL